jgi:hypothetical protein
MGVAMAVVGATLGDIPETVIGPAVFGAAKWSAGIFYPRTP